MPFSFQLSQDELGRGPVGQVRPGPEAQQQGDRRAGLLHGQVRQGEGRSGEGLRQEPEEAGGQIHAQGEQEGPRRRREHSEQGVQVSAGHPDLL